MNILKLYTLSCILEILVHTMSLEINILAYEVVLMIVIFLQLAYAHKPKSPNVV